MLPVRIQRVIVFQLAKAQRLGVSLTPGGIARVFGLNPVAVYMFLERLAEEGIVERTSRGQWVLRDTRVAEQALALAPETPHPFWAPNVPETHYYVADPGVDWLGWPGKTLVVVDRVLRGRIRPPAEYLVVYTGMGGRKWCYAWDMGVSRASREQAVADLLSYDPDYPAEHYIYYNLDRLDLDDVARRATPEGLRRLATFLAFLRTATGREPPVSIEYFRLLDPGILEERLADYVSIVFANGVAEARGI